MASSSITALLQSCKTSKGDECYTPEIAIKPLLKYLDKDKIYYDCTSSKSLNIVKTFLKYSYTCLPSKDKDFLKDDIPEKIDVIITNPPYSLKDKFIERCYQLNKPFALLLPVTALQGQKRGILFAKYGIELLVLNKRIDFTGKGSPHFGVAWFCFNILPQSLIFEKDL